MKAANEQVKCLTDERPGDICIYRLPLTATPPLRTQHCTHNTKTKALTAVYRNCTSVCKESTTFGSCIAVLVEENNFAATSNTTFIERRERGVMAIKGNTHNTLS